MGEEAVIYEKSAHVSKDQTRPPETAQSFGSGLFGPEQFQGARVRLALVELLQGLRE